MPIDNEFDMSNPLVRQLVRNEGKRNKVYKDTKGNPTIGVGFSLRKPNAKEKLESVGADFSSVIAGEPISNGQMADLLNDDINEMSSLVSGVFPNWEQMNNTRQRALIEVGFTTGRQGLRGFNNMVSAIHTNDWETAADELEDSEWYRKTVGKERGDAVVSMLRHGPGGEAPLPSPRAPRNLKGTDLITPSPAKPEGEGSASSSNS